MENENDLPIIFHKFQSAYFLSSLLMEDVFYLNVFQKFTT